MPVEPDTEPPREDPLSPSDHGLGGAGPSWEVHACSAPARLLAIVLQALAAGNLLYIAAHLVVDIVEGTRSAPPLAVALGLAVFSGLPWAGAALLRRLSTGTLELRTTSLVLTLRRVRYEIPLASITAVRPLWLPLPGPGIALEMTSGRRFRHRLLLDDPSGVVSALDDAGTAAGRAAAHPAIGWAHARREGTRRRWYFWAAKYGLVPLVITIIVFRLHQYIVYGGPFGQYHLFGLTPYLTSFVTLWAGTAGGLVVYAGVVRSVAEGASLLATFAAPSRARLVRRVTEGLCHFAYFGLIPGYVAARLLL